jgi:hypothetical protein
VSGKVEATIDGKSALIGIAAGVSAYSVLLWIRRGVMKKLRKKAVVGPSSSDPLLALRGSGKRLWADEHADDYVARLREGWGTGTSPTAND